MAQSIEKQIKDLKKRLGAKKIGSLRSLYDKVFDGDRVYSLAYVEEDEEPPFRILCPPATEEEVALAEEELGFTLPALLRAVYMEIGNGGYLLHLIGIEEGQGGFDDLGFRNESIVAAYRFMRKAWQEYKGTPWPEKLLPIDDGCGCGMIDAIDCNTPEGVIWRSDSGILSQRLPSLYDFLIEAIDRIDLPSQEEE